MQQIFSTLSEIQSQYAWLKEMRETQPVWLDKQSGCWHVFRYADVHRAITDYDVFSSERRQQRLALQSAGRPEGGQQNIGRSILTMDPPEHRQYRNLVSSAFTPRSIERLRGRVAEITQDLLDETRATGSMDFATDLAYP